MQFDFSQITHEWNAHGKSDRIWTISVLPSGLFKATGTTHVHVCRTFSEAQTRCEYWEAACSADDASIWQESGVGNAG